MPIGSNVSPIAGLDPQVIAQILANKQGEVSAQLDGKPGATLQGMYQAKDDMSAMTDQYLQDAQLRRLLQLKQNRDLMGAQAEDDANKDDVAFYTQGLETPHMAKAQGVPDVGDPERLQTIRQKGRESGAKNMKDISAGVKDRVDAGDPESVRGRTQKDLELTGADESMPDLSMIPSLRAADRAASAVENAAETTAQSGTKNLQMRPNAQGVLVPTEVTEQQGRKDSTKETTRTKGKSVQTGPSVGVDAHAEVQALAAQFNASPLGKTMKLTKVVPDGKGGGYFHTDKGTIHVPASKAK